MIYSYFDQDSNPADNTEHDLGPGLKVAEHFRAPATPTGEHNPAPPAPVSPSPERFYDFPEDLRTSTLSSFTRINAPPSGEMTFPEELEVPLVLERKDSPSPARDNPTITSTGQSPSSERFGTTSIYKELEPTRVSKSKISEPIIVEFFHPETSPPLPQPAINTTNPLSPVLSSFTPISPPPDNFDLPLPHVGWGAQKQNLDITQSGGEEEFKSPMTKAGGGWGSTGESERPSTPPSGGLGFGGGDGSNTPRPPPIASSSGTDPQQQQADVDRGRGRGRGGRGGGRGKGRGKHGRGGAHA